MKALHRITILLFVLALGVYFGVQYYYNTTLDRVSPVLNCGDEILDGSVRDGDAALLAGVTATDNVDGDLTDQIMIQGVSRLLSADTARVTYVVFDSSNNMATCSRMIRYTDYEAPRIQLEEPLVFYTYPQSDCMTEMASMFKAQDVLDGDISDRLQITSTNISDSYEGTYSAVVQVINSLGDVESVPVKVVISNSGAAKQLIELSRYVTYVNRSSVFDPDSYITYSAARVQIESNVDTGTPGCYQVRYSCEANGQSYEVYMAVGVR